LYLFPHFCTGVFTQWLTRATVKATRQSRNGTPI
jgi:hypothetical protein